MIRRYIVKLTAKFISRRSIPHDRIVNRRGSTRVRIEIERQRGAFAEEGEEGSHPAPRATADRDRARGASNVERERLFSI